MWKQVVNAKCVKSELAYKSSCVSAALPYISVQHMYLRSSDVIHETRDIESHRYLSRAEERAQWVTTLMCLLRLHKKQ
jgi:hypothetical protein